MVARSIRNMGLSYYRLRIILMRFRLSLLLMTFKF
jgi:hypothetical protein